MIDYDKFSLRGKTAIITGGGGLLGGQHAKALVELGCTVVITDINLDLLKSNQQKIFEDTGTKVKISIMDVSDENEVKKVSEALYKEGYEINILINNAAIDPKVDKQQVVETSRLENFKIEDWDFQLNVGLKGAMICTKVFGQRMALNKKGVILNIASDLSVIAPDQRLYYQDNINENQQPVKPITYSVIKHGLIGLTKYTASYWANKGIRCNALSPGGVYTNQNDNFVRRITNLIPMQRMARIDEYIGAVQFLCSDASLYLNGQNIVMDGGRSII